MKSKVMPPLVLTIICVIVSGLLAMANELTKDKVAEAQQNKLQSSLEKTFGEAEYTVVNQTYDKINQVIRDDSGRVIFDITVDGYSKGGLQLLIGIDAEGKTCGVGIVACGETPGLGTKVQDDKSFSEQFLGQSSTDYDFNPITGATYSSKGMKNAVDIAIETYNENKEAILK